MELELHPIQSDILLFLLFTPKARFSELNTTNMSSDHFNFHIQKLLKVKLVEKVDEKHYQLTNNGKEFANRFDTDSVALERQAKLSVLVIGVRKKGKSKEYLVQQRLKQPFYGYFGAIGGKIRWGETIDQAAARELKEESGLKAKLEFKGIEHKMDYDTEGKLLEDKYFYIFRASNCSGKLSTNINGGRNMWLTRESILTKKRFQDFLDVMEMVDNSDIDFVEKKFTVKDY